MLLYFHMMYTLSDNDKKEIAEHGKEVLSRIPKMPYGCAYMSALWGASIKDHTDIPVEVIAGNLSINNKKIFYSDRSPQSIAQDFKSSNLAWDGHVWVSFAGMIGDISIFRSAYSEPESHWFHQLIVNEFGKGKGLLLGNLPNMEYTAKYILTDDEITSLIQSLGSILTL